MASSMLNLDRSYFTVISRLFSGTLVQPELEPDWTRKEVEKMARAGQFDTVLAIFEHNPVEGWSADITADVFPDSDDNEPAAGDIEDTAPLAPFEYHRERIDAARAGLTSRVAA